jgi:hypothetical protein
MYVPTLVWALNFEQSDYLQSLVPAIVLALLDCNEKKKKKRKKKTTTTTTIDVSHQCMFAQTVSEVHRVSRPLHLLTQ